ncbi:MAG: GreA/GreB family elongation factor [Candidatus Saccharimonadales bacterium]
MNTATIVYLSKKGFKELKKQIARLSHDIEKNRSELRELDKSDSHEERFARIQKLASLQASEAELYDKQQTLKTARLLPRKRDRLFVAIGSVVDMIDSKGRLLRYTIVDSFEANPSDGRISDKSPLGQSLLGKQIKDTVEWGRAGKTQRLELIRIA